MTYQITIEHHSIARARCIEFAGPLAEAKRLAEREFGAEQRDYLITIREADGPHWGSLVASRPVGGRKWTDRQ
jgi:hypothetical protein